MTEPTWMLPPLTSGQGGCGNCPPKPVILPLDTQPHPGFGGLELTCDDEVPEWWWTFRSWPTTPLYFKPEWITGTVKVGPNKGKPWGFWSGGEHRWTLDETVTIGDIEEAVADDPDHDWRLVIDGAMNRYVYQRHAPATWALVEKGIGFA